MIIKTKKGIFVLIPNQKNYIKITKKIFIHDYSIIELFNFT